MSRGDRRDRAADMTGLAAALRAFVGADAVLDKAEDIAGYRGDLACPTGGDILCVVRPRTTQETAVVVKACAAAGVSLAPRGGGTGLAGGATPEPGRSSVVISFERMRQIRSIDPIGNVMVVEAGCTLHAAQQAAADAGRFLGLDHGAASSQIGGNLSTNAGGNNVLRYGMARDQVLGLEVVLADGRVISRLMPLRKNNAGYDLKQVFLGSEGTLGLITAAALHLRPAAVVSATACIGAASLEAVLEFFVLARRTLGEAISAFEIMPREGLEFHFAHIGKRREPFEARTPWIVLVEADSASAYFNLAEAFEALLATAIENGMVVDGTIAATQAQRQALWSLREGIAVAMVEAPGSLKSDTAVPVAAIAEFVAQARVSVDDVVPGCIPVPFGHVGDGNIHFNVLPPVGMSSADFSAKWSDLARAIEDVALSLGGTISAEHGIGLVKRVALKRALSSTELDVMRTLKLVFDPGNILNPGKIL
ncbi:FAD-binding oxidoreductase [Bradyrhizobium sp. Ash2021]|uniref:FAD-binding oxidoreductase n=1 Tax=Bradyrhizobium sp. Ash2021 TaxID=2954771 RepID=UPI0028151FB4|nr:FAD-binding oxidoreductase [Bradyrhizobium sp. Ash2021]WMT75964.1 FAD-binding oxidoreductase [Bradyrhizobium sp. Ash2021]